MSTAPFSAGAGSPGSSVKLLKASATEDETGAGEGGGDGVARGGETVDGWPAGSTAAMTTGDCCSDDAARSRPGGVAAPAD